MKPTVRLLAAVLVVAMAGQGFATQVGAQTLGRWDRPEARIDVQATRWNPGSPMTLTASNFSANENVDIAFDGEVLATESVSTSGAVQIDATVPTKAPGTYRITAKGEQSQREAEFYYNIQAFNPWAEPSGYWVPVGTPLTFTGHRFANGETVDVWLDGAVVASSSANAEGEFTGAGPYVVPRAKFGQNLDFQLRGETSNATASFRVGVANWPLLPSEPETPVDPVDPVDPDPAGPSLVTTSLIPTYGGEARWQSLEWQGGDFDVCDFEVTADAGTGNFATYPSGQTSSHPSTNRTLSANESDFTAIRFGLGSAATGSNDIDLVAKYRACDSSNFVEAAFSVDLPTRTPGDPALRQVSSEVGSVSSNSSTWVNVDFAADGPNVTDVRVAAGAPSGIGVAYPAERNFTSPARESYIDAGSQDYVALRLDVANLAPGIYVIPLTATFGSPTQTAQYSISVVVQ